MLSRRSVERFALLLVMSSLAACVRISATALGEPPAPSIPEDSVRVFATNAPPLYKEVAVLKAHRFLASDSKVLETLRRHAASLGANGVLLLNTRGGGSQTHSTSGVILGGPNSGGIVMGSGTSKVDDFERAVAIRWVGEGGTTYIPPAQ
jgi:hypothetical protein